MSGGQLVVMDRSGRDVKRYSLPEGLVTLGSDPDCDIRVMLPAIRQHHATVVVHANQTIVRNVSDGETLVNGHVVSVAALRHGDVITLGDRSLRWEYYEPTVPRPLAPEPALYVKRKTKSHARKRGSEVASRRIEPAVRLALEMKHRASMPAATKQVAVVQLQRRDETVNTIEAKTRLVTKPHRPYIQNRKAQRSMKLSTSRELRNSRKRMTQPDQNISHTNETEVRYSSIETDISMSENKSSTRSRKTKSPRNENTSNRTMAEDTSQNVTPKQASNLTHDSEKMNRKSKTILTSDSPKNRTPKSRNSKSITNMSSNALLENSTETKASQWIASRKTSPRKSHTPKTNEENSAKYVHVATPRPKEPYVEKSPSKMLASSSPIKVVPKRSTPLRTVVLKKMVTPNDRNKSLLLSAKRTQSVPKIRVQKIEEPLHLDDNKKAALMLLTRTSKSNFNVKPKTPVLALKKSSPLKTTPKKERQSKRISKEVQSTNLSAVETSDVSDLSPNYESEMIDEGSLSSLRSQIVSPPLPSPKKSAMKDPSVKRNSKKIESIKFDLSNIESSLHDEVETKASSAVHNRSNILPETEENLTLRYSESPPPTPSPRRPIHSRSSKIMEKTLGETFSINSSEYDSTRKSVAPSLTPRKSLRSSLIVEKALTTSLEENTHSPRMNRNKSQSVTVDTSSKGKVSGKGRSLNNMETYSIVDLVSLNSSDPGSVIDLESVEANESGISSSIYDSVASDHGSTRSYHSSAINNSQRSSPRLKTYSLTPSHIGTSTPYAGKITSRKSLLHNKTASETLNSPINNISPRKSKSLVSQSYRSNHGQTNDNSEDTTVEIKQGDTFTITSSLQSISSKTRSNTTFDVSNSGHSKTLRSSPPKKNKSKQLGSKNSLMSQASNEEPSTPPENVITMSEPTTPILNIQHLLDSSNMSVDSDSNKAQTQRRGRKRQTVGPSIDKRKRMRVTRSVWTDPKKSTRLSRVSKVNLNSVKKSFLKKLGNNSSGVPESDESVIADDGEEKVTPKSTVKLVQPGVKEIHSTAKKPVSKRSIIDDLSESVIVKQLFNSPVKRKLSHSMIEFSKNEFTEDNTTKGKRRRTAIGLTNRTLNQSLDLENVNTPQVPTEVFVSPMTTSQQSPKLDGLKRLFVKNTPNNDLRNISGVNRLLRTPRKQKSPRNDLSNVLGVKETFSKRSPTNDLTNVTGVKHLYGVTRRSKTRLSGVRSLFQFDERRKSPKNDLTDIKGVKRLFTVEESKLQRKKPSRDVSRGKKEISRSDLNFSGVEELFEGSCRMNLSPNRTFDKLLGKPQIKATYSKSYRAKSKTPIKRSKAAQSFHEPVDFTSMNVESWLDEELIKKTQKGASVIAAPREYESKNVSINRELQKLATDTVEGKTPILKSRVRNRTVNNSISYKLEQKRNRLSNFDHNSLPIKKRSLVNVLGTPREKPIHRKSSLPIKKRTIIHSTPVANKHTFVSSVSDLERVSPIVVDRQDSNPEVFHLITSIKTPIKEALSKSKQKSPKETNQLKQINAATSERKVKRTRASKLEIPKSPKATRTRRGTNVADIGITKNIQRSLVITKKPPVISPRVISGEKVSRRGRKTKTELNLLPSSTSLAGKQEKSPVELKRRTRGKGTRGMVVERDVSEDITVKNKKERETKSRARNKRKSLTPAIIVMKPSPKMKPQPKKTTSRQATQKSPIQERKDHGKRIKTIVNEAETTEKPIRTNQRRTKKIENIEINIQLPRTTRRGGNVVTAKKSPRKPNKSVSKQETKTSSRTRLTHLSENKKQVQNNNMEKLNERKQAKGKKRIINDTVVTEEEVVPRKTRKTVALAEDAGPKRGMSRRTIKTAEASMQIERKTRGRSKKIESPKKTTSGKKKKDSPVVAQEKLPRGRKKNDEIVEPGVSTEGKKSARQGNVKKSKVGEGKAKKSSPVNPRLTRSQKKTVQAEAPIEPAQLELWATHSITPV
ncbi:Proliferation marker protein Ki-67 [Eumeta japonica]|uniref:Proliferation marker protein Ki-67 n=1 Tax=Eumeta variegata TaxID=151549 RepID=A0A4C1UQR9_EUMVA|nr:Proliferation marker protein Ki-67 [Eumeta japonica]